MNLRTRSVRAISCSRAACHSLFQDRAMLLADFVIATSIPFIIQILVWNFIFRHDESITIHGFSQKDIIFYYAIALTMGRLNNGYDVIRQISEHLDAGTIEPMITKPLSVPVRHFYIFIGESLVYLIPVGASLAACAYYSNENVWSYGLVALTLIMIVLSQAVTYLLSLTIGLVAFWLTKPDFLCSLHIILLAVLGGTWLPASLWPTWLEPVMAGNPFYLQIGAIADFSVHPNYGFAFHIVALQLLWTSALMLGSCVFWRLGIRRLANTGG